MPPTTPQLDDWAGQPGIEAEIAAEAASNLGRMGRRVEETLAALAVSGEREALLDEAVRAVWYYFIQREASGQRDHREAIAIYGIPPEVLRRLGTVR
jgi:hypothetical protein